MMHAARFCRNSRKSYMAGRVKTAVAMREAGCVREADFST